MDNCELGKEISLILTPNDWYACMTFSKIIFTSSTSVYPQLDIVFDETYDLNQLPGKNSIIEAENVLRAHFSDRLTILRLGGLIGHDRHPIRFLTGRTIAKSGSDKISLIHFELH